MTPKLYPVWRKETKLGYQYLIGLHIPKDSLCPPNISLRAHFVYYISAFSLKEAAMKLKNNLEKLEPKPAYWGHEANRLNSK